MMLLRGKTALITGCNRGIGRAILEKYAEHGAVIYANARCPHSLDVLAGELGEKYNTEIIPVYFNVTDKEAVKQCYLRIRQERNQLDVLVNNAGIMRDALIGMVDDKIIEDVFSVNVYAVITMIQYAVRIMSRQNKGSIINLASIVGEMGNPGQTVYAASKGAVIALTKTLAKELCSRHIRVNAIAPGMIDTDMFRSIGEARMKESIARIGYGRLGYPDEIADAAVFLASDMAAYITGQIVGVNGSTII
ncbi:MAG: SDR family oxidoreductase [Peptococcaceae bacterium]|nr:SDR family oxidoreductase [Peptococcaceae bacterium]